MCEIGKPEMQQKINVSLGKEGIEETAERLQTTVHTLQVIIDGLSQPKTFDIRTGELSPLSPGSSHRHLRSSRQERATGEG
jgi:hypothetical protein